ncbi:class I SAM-dependent methyltransferase [Bradyrhizobium sp.]|uniref:class I SAM-dependent methyltransferase n=1 Tax=Bradyrhizobium sp. TaxID=376 RepID=UPI0039E6925C
MNDPATANLVALKHPKNTAAYTAPRDLLKPELLILSRLEREFTGKRILDLGIGGGQTTPALLKISADYIGTELVPAMVAICRSRFPSVRFEVCDATDMSQFADASFDLVIFFGAGMDGVGHTGRMKILREAHRVLSDGGAFAFSTHNLGSEVRRPWEVPRLQPWKTNPFLQPKEFVRRSVRLSIAMLNHQRKKAQEERHSGYALLNDAAGDFSFILYYVSPSQQTRQLIEAGFSNIEAIDEQGEPANESCSDTWLFFSCRKA